MKNGRLRFSMDTRRLLMLVIGIAVFVVLLLVLAAGSIVIGVLKVVDNSTAHRCGLAYVQRSPAAIRMLGSPIEQRGITSGSSSTENGATHSELTFKVGGPLGEATVDAKSSSSDFQSRLTVLLGRNGESTTIYDGRADCPELHQSK